MTTGKSITYSEAAAMLRQKGYSLRTAAPLLDVHFGHLHHVLQGRRESRRLLAAIERLPNRTLPRMSRKS